MCQKLLLNTEWLKSLVGKFNRRKTQNDLYKITPGI